MKRWLSLAPLAAAALLTTGAGAETLVDAQGLAAMEGLATWPIVDARDLSERSQQPIPGTLEFGPEFEVPAKLLVSGKLLVIGPDTATARRVAKQIEGRIPGITALVPEGGLEMLRGVRPDLGGMSSSVGGRWVPSTFTIPRDTCQPGTPAHVFSDQKAD